MSNMGELLLFQSSLLITFAICDMIDAKALDDLGKGFLHLSMISVGPIFRNSLRVSPQLKIQPSDVVKFGAIPAVFADCHDLLSGCCNTEINFRPVFDKAEAAAHAVKGEAKWPEFILNAGNEFTHAIDIGWGDLCPLQLNKAIAVFFTSAKVIYELLRFLSERGGRPARLA